MKYVDISKEEYDNFKGIKMGPQRTFNTEVLFCARCGFRDEDGYDLEDAVFFYYKNTETNKAYADCYCSECASEVEENK